MLPTFSAPPANTWIVVERPEPDRLILRWLPNAGRKAEWERWQLLLMLACMTLSWLLGLLRVGGMWLAAASPFLSGPGPRGSDAVLGAAYAGVLLDVMIL